MPKDMITYTPDMEKKLVAYFKHHGDEFTPEMSSLVSGAITAHEHAFADFGITKEKYLEWIGKAWDAGKRQKKIYDGEEEGGINNEIGVSRSFACNLVMYGRDLGFLAEKK